MAAKIFEVGDVLPATTQLRLTVDFNDMPEDQYYIVSTTSSYIFMRAEYAGSYNSDVLINDINIDRVSSTGGIHIYDLDISTLTESQRTVTDVDADFWTWEDLNAPSGFSVTFEENGGSTVTDLTEQTNLPSPLPIPTRPGYTFLGWYYDDLFTQEATAGDELEYNVTLYAKWELTTYTITYNTNGGSSVSQTSNATQLPNPLPPTAKPGYTFGGWYYESNFQTRAKAGDMIEANTTLYAKWLTLAQVLEHINNVVEELRSAIIDKGGDAEGKLLIDFATIINSLKTYEVVETLAELELLEPTLNRVVYVVEGSGELTMGAPVKVTQDGDTLIIG